MDTLIKETKPMGNSSGVYLPKEWEHKRVMIRLLSPREMIMDTIKDHMPSVMGVYLHGSIVRNEIEKDSDIDVLVVTTQGVNLESDILDIVCITEDAARKLLREDPIQLYPMISEAVTVINDRLLEELKGIKPTKKSFKRLISTTEERLEGNKELIAREEKLSAVIYSTILRSRAVYIAEQLLKGRQYSKAKYRDYLLRQGIDDDSIGRLIGVYRAVRDDTILPRDLPYLDDVKDMQRILSNQLKRFRRVHYGKS